MEENSELEGLEFEPVDATPEATPGAAPDPAGATVFPSGMVKTNTRGTQLWVELCTEVGVDYRLAVTEMGANKARKLVQVKAVPELQAKKPVPIRWHGSKGQLVSMHLGGVFLQYPELRPVGRRTATIAKTKDKNGVPCLVISLQTALPKRVVGRSKADGQDPSAE